jgi:transcriptional regulator of acetoin/glycerol metabolism
MENVLQQTLLLSPFVVILPENLPERFAQQKENKEKVALPDISPLEAAERDQIRQTLKETSWNQSKTAQLLGIDRKTLRLKIRRYDLLDEKLSTGGKSSAER